MNARLFDRSRGPRLPRSLEHGLFCLARRPAVDRRLLLSARQHPIWRGRHGRSHNLKFKFSWCNRRQLPPHRLASVERPEPPRPATHAAGARYQSLMHRSSITSTDTLPGLPPWTAGCKWRACSVPEAKEPLLVVLRRSRESRLCAAWTRCKPRRSQHETGLRTAAGARHSILCYGLSHGRLQTTQIDRR